MTNHKLDTDERVCFYEQEFYVLSNFSSFRVLYRGYDQAAPATDYQTAEHAYQAQKFLPYRYSGRDHTGFYEIYRSVRDARSAHAAARIAHIYDVYLAPDWNERRLQVMRSILKAKHQEHEYVRRKLAETGDRELIEDSWRDDFWGIGPNGDGQNMLGKLWMELRAELRGEAGAPFAVQADDDVLGRAAHAAWKLKLVTDGFVDHVLEPDGIEQPRRCRICGGFQRIFWHPDNRHHPDMVPYADLPEAKRQKYIVMARAGYVLGHEAGSAGRDDLVGAVKALLVAVQGSHVAAHRWQEVNRFNDGVTLDDELDAANAHVDAALARLEALAGEPA